MRLTADWIEAPPTARVVAALEAPGHRALFVGGCVRDALLGRPVGDVDIATDARPEAVLAAAAAAGLRAVPTGIDHGTVTLVALGRSFEVTTFRRDVATDGRRAVVGFTRDVAEDAARRDFTLNALYATAAGDLVDPLGGLADLLARRIRFVGDPVTRIREDYLRILRWFRFRAWYARPTDPPDAAALAAITAEAHGLPRLSRERIGAEMRRLLAAPDPAQAVLLMAETGTLARILPGAAPHRLAALLAVEAGIGAAPDAIRRLAALSGDDPAGAFRLSRAEAARLDRLTAGITEPAGAAEMAWRFGAETARDVELLRAAAFDAPLPATLQADIAAGAAARFPVAAADLMPAHEGATLGRRLAELERAWIDSGFAASRDELLSRRTGNH